MNAFQKKLDTLKSKNRYRTLSLPNGIDMSSNDYLGFREHDFMKQAARTAIDNGVAIGSGGSRLLRGHMREHEELETYAAQFFGAESALFFANGYQANSAIFSSLPTRHDTIIFDEFVHASAREAIHNSPAKTIKITHNDLSEFEDALKRTREKTGAIWIAAESLYSMDGDIAPLDDLITLSKKYDAYCIFDEAHATGIFGNNGRGLSDHTHDRLITLHTCGKALGTAGGLVCGPRDIIDTMINTARPFIYSTAPPPLQAHLAHKSLELCASDIGDRQRKILRDLIAHAVDKFDHAQSQIIPIIVGDDERAVEIAAAMQNAGYDIRAIRPPTVPDGTARLRLSLNAGLTIDILNGLTSALKSLI